MEDQKLNRGIGMNLSRDTMMSRDAQSCDRGRRRRDGVEKLVWVVC